MFKDCSSLKKLDVSGFDTSKADTLKEMFFRLFDSDRVGRKRFRHE